MGLAGFLILQNYGGRAGRVSEALRCVPRPNIVTLVLFLVLNPAPAKGPRGRFHTFGMAAALHARDYDRKDGVIITGRRGCITRWNGELHIPSLSCTLPSGASQEFERGGARWGELGRGGVPRYTGISCQNPHSQPPPSSPGPGRTFRKMDRISQMERLTMSVCMLGRRQG